MPTATKKSVGHKSTLRRLNNEVAGLRARVEDLEDLRDLNVAIARNAGQAGVPWKQAKRQLGLLGGGLGRKTD